MTHQECLEELVAQLESQPDGPLRIVHDVSGQRYEMTDVRFTDNEIVVEIGPA